MDVPLLYVVIFPAQSQELKMLLKGLFLHLLSFLTFSKAGFMLGPHSLNMSLTRTTAASEIIVTTLKRISEKNP